MAHSRLGIFHSISPAGLIIPVSMWITVRGTPRAKAASASGVAAPTAKPSVDAAIAFFRLSKLCRDSDGWVSVKLCKQTR